MEWHALTEKRTMVGKKKSVVTENFQGTKVRSIFMEMSNHSIERERGKLKT